MASGEANSRELSTSARRVCGCVCFVARRAELRAALLCVLVYRERVGDASVVANIFFF